MNIKSVGSPEDCPDWMKRFKPTDLKWLNTEKTAALCVASDNRYRLRIIWTKDGSVQKTGFTDISDGVELEKMQEVFDGFEPSDETGSMSPEQIAEQLRTRLAA